MFLPALYVDIFQRDQLPLDKEELKINGHVVKLFREVLLGQMALKKSRTGWCLEFFSGTEYVQRFFVKFTKYEGSGDVPERHNDALTALAYVQVGADASTSMLRQACEQTSLYVRGSRAVKQEHLYEASTHWGYVDGRGAQYLSKIEGGTAQFERHVLLHALAYAYLLTMEEMGNRLSEMLPANAACEDALRQLYKDVALFNAKSFFHQPVKLSNGPTCETWRRIDDALGIRTSNTELFKQVESAHYIYGLDEEKQAAQRREKQEKDEKEKACEEAQLRLRQERKEKRRDLGLTLVGLLLALVSAPGAIELVKSWW